MKKITPKKILLICSPNYSIHMLNEEIDNIRGATSDFTSAVDWRPALPLGILYLAATLRKNNIKVEILDLHLLFNNCRINGYFIKNNLDDFFKDHLEKYLIKNKQEIVGISSLFNVSFTSVAEIAKRTKKTNNDIKVVLGGHFPTNEFKTIFKNKNINCDYIVLGEGELALTELIKNIGTNNINNLVAQHSHIVDVNTFNKDNKNKGMITDLDELPEPAYDMLPELDEYIMNSLHSQRMGSEIIEQVKSIALYTSRGCPLQCTFCASHGVHGRKFRSHSIDYLIDHIDDLVKKYDVNQLLIEDDMFNISKKRTIEFCKRLVDKYGERFSLEFPNGLACWLLDDEVIKWLKKAGMKTITVAVESGSNYVQWNILKKRLKLDKIKEVVNLLKENDIHTRGFFIVGFIGETLEQMEETIQFASDLDLDWAEIKILTPLAGSEMYDLAISNGYLDNENESFSEHVYGRSCLNTPEFTAEQVKQVQYDGNIRVNFLNNRALRLGKFTEAEITFSKLVKNYPNHFLAHWGLWKSLLGQSKYDEANEVQNSLKTLCEENEDNYQLINKYKLGLPFNKANSFLASQSA